MNIETSHKYEYAVDLAAQTAPAFVVHMVGSSKRVLEVGCGPGSITKQLTQHGLCRVTALELDPEAITRVAPYCEAIMKADLNSAEWPHLLDGVERFDVVVAADVLEHLYDPWTALKRMMHFISGTGCLVISLPHVGHAAVVSCLINGDFEYRDWGLLDRTHIRFFGLKNIEELFAQADLKIIEVRYVVKPPEETEFAASWRRLSAAMQDALKSSDHADVYQVVVKAVPLSYPGDAVPLVPPRSQRTRVAIPALWKRRIANYLSRQTKHRIRQSLSLLGIRV
jgi:2-polyprenyl-3-methyl-5-hydroxy-6-metoxy-1,4-benzoquinol methylase